MEYYIVFFIYMVFLLVVGSYFYNKNKNTEDYILGGRKMGPYVTALSAGSSDMSGWLLLGLPGYMYASGLVSLWISVFLALGSLLNWVFVASRLRLFTEKLKNSLTISKYLEERFRDDSHFIRLLSAFATLLFFTLYVATGLVAGAKLFEEIFGFSYEVSLIVGGGIIAVYTMAGGFSAVSWTDFFQGLFMLTVLVLVPILIFVDPNEPISGIKDINPELLDITGGLSTVGIISLCAWGLGYFGQPHILSRFMAIRDVSLIPRARNTAVVWTILSMTGALLIGFLGIIYTQFNGITVNDPEKILLILSKILFNPWFSAFVMVAILSAVMSTIDSQLLISSAVIVEDLYKPFIYKTGSEFHYKVASQVTVFIVFVIALFLGSNSNSTILQMVGYAWAGFGASFGPILLFSLFWKKTTKQGAIAGILMGIISVVFWKNMSGGIFDLYELLPSFIISGTSIMVVSLLTEDKVSEEIFENIR